MAMSMTGYGRAKQLINGRDILVEVKSVNSRYLDASIKLGRMYNSLEEKLKQLAVGYISRGKIDIYVYIENLEGEKIELTLNKEYLESFLEQLDSIKNEYKISGEVDINMLAAKNDIFNIKKIDEDMNEVWLAVEEVAKAAFAAFTEMRAFEGEKLKKDILERIEILKELSRKIKTLSPQIVTNSNNKMVERVKELLANAAVDESRLLTECAIYADKSDITEELVRLDSHFNQLNEILNETVPVGRKIDFLLQEMNREINTIGSKSNDTELAKCVIDAKSELEKIREQIQNIE
ncbi:YicC family protein [Eubacteriales bacterium OttesenSCG-928-G02]|nr:YicC family protein [Eubacteriales bacterium OttesenSCG-928-G02]